MSIGLNLFEEEGLSPKLPLICSAAVTLKRPVYFNKQMIETN